MSTCELSQEMPHAQHETYQRPQRHTQLEIQVLVAVSN